MSGFNLINLARELFYLGLIIGSFTGIILGGTAVILWFF